MFLKSAMSLLKIEGRRIRFRCKPPMLPAVPGLTKQAGLMAYASPVASLSPVFVFGLQVTSGRAAISPPVKSVIVVDVQVVVDPGDKTKPAVQLSPDLIV